MSTYQVILVVFPSCSSVATSLIFFFYACVSVLWQLGLKVSTICWIEETLHFEIYMQVMTIFKFRWKKHKMP